MLDKVKEHVGRHKVAYSLGTIVVIAGVSYWVGVRTGSSFTLSELSNKGTVVGINNKMNQTVVQLVDRSGPPSWVIRCIETGEETLSQHEMASLHGLRVSDLRAHLNGYLDSVNDKHYVRLGLAAA